MKRLLIALMLAATPLLAQKATEDPGKKAVAVVGSETITAEKLDWMYAHLSDEMRAQYAASGGKSALLENYIRKTLLLQQAKKSGFDKRADVQRDLEAARENILFDRYVRDVVAQTIITDSSMREYYNEHPNEFNVPEMVRLRHIGIGVSNTGPHPHSEAEALSLAKKAWTDILLTIPRLDPTAAAAAAHENAAKFAKMAHAYSEDSLAATGGDLGWVTRGQLDPELQATAFEIHTGVPSGIVKTKNGYHIIFVEAKRAAGTLSFDEAKPRIREALLRLHANDIVAAVNQLTDDLGDKTKIAVHPENIQ